MAHTDFDDDRDDDFATAWLNAATSPTSRHGTCIGLRTLRIRRKVVGVVTLENVLEPIVGAVEDEFDDESPPMVEEGNGRFLVRGDAPLAAVNRRLNLSLEADDVDTFSGYLTARVGRVLQVGDKLDLEGAVAEVVEVDGTRATRILLRYCSSVSHREVSCSSESALQLP